MKKKLFFMSCTFCLHRGSFVDPVKNKMTIKTYYKFKYFGGNGFQCPFYHIENGKETTTITLKVA